MENSQLISKFRDISLEHTLLTKEILTKRINKEFSDEEWKEVDEIVTRSSAIIFDTIPSDKLNEKTIKDGIQTSIDICMNKNR